MKHTAKVIIAGLCCLMAIPAFSKKKKAGEDVVPQSEDRITILQHQVDSLQQRLLELEKTALPLQADVDTALSHLFAHKDGQLLLKVDCDRIYNDLLQLEYISPMLKYYCPVNIREIDVYRNCLNALLESAMPVQEYYRMPSRRYTDAEYKTAIADLEKLISEYKEFPENIEELQLVKDNLVDDKFLRGKLKPRITAMKKQFALLPKAESALKVIAYMVESVEKIKEDANWTGGANGYFPDDFVYINTLVGNIYDTLDDYPANRTKLATEQAFGKWVDSIAGSL